MESILIPALTLGLLLLFFGWIRVIFASFKHHSTTGLLSLIPVVNLLTLPSVWHRVGGSVIAGFIGFVLIIASLVLGAGTQLSKVSGDMGVKLPSAAEKPAQPKETVSSSLALPNSPATAQPTPAPLVTKPPTVDAVTGAMELPKAALYSMVYKPLAFEKLPEHYGSYLRITRKDRSRLEGKLLNVENQQVIIKQRTDTGEIEQKIPLAHINTLEMMERE